MRGDGGLGVGNRRQHGSFGLSATRLKASRPKAIRRHEVATLKQETLWGAIALPAIILAAMIATAIPGRAAPLEPAQCDAAKLEQDQMTDIPAILERGPAWAKAHLNARDLTRVSRWIELQEIVVFRCRRGPVTASAQRAAAEAELIENPPAPPAAARPADGAQGAGAQGSGAKAPGAQGQSPVAAAPTSATSPGAALGAVVAPKVPAAAVAGEPSAVVAKPKPKPKPKPVVPQTGSALAPADVGTAGAEDKPQPVKKKSPPKPAVIPAGPKPDAISP
jgi:hypothetical protein